MAPDTQLRIMIDIQTSGPIIGTHSMTELGAVAGSAKQGVLDRFAALIRPIGTAVVASEKSFEEARRSGQDSARAMKEFAAWCAPFQKKKTLFIARPAAFDWPWIVWYAWTSLGENPFGFRAACAS
jgi:ribonuclease T